MYNILKNEDKNQKEGMVLAKAIFKAYSRDFIILLFVTLLFIAFSMYAPIITDLIISYI